MSNGNSVTLDGNITRDPELRFTNTGQATATFGLAVNRMWTDRQTNERREVTSDEVGQSLRRATAVVRKNDRRGPSDGGCPSRAAPHPTDVTAHPAYEY